MLAYPWALAIACVALIGASYFCYASLGSDLLPAMDEGGFILDYLMPAGSSLVDTNQVLLGVEKILSATPEVETTSRRTGLQLGIAAVTEANTGDFSVKLKGGSRRGIDEVISDVRAEVNKTYPQLDVEFVQVLQDMIGDLTSSPEPIEIKLFSPDPLLLKTWGPKIAEKIKKIKGVADVKDGIENTISGPAIVMNVDPVVAARSGFTPQEIELDASAILQGEPAATPVVVNDRSYTIRVRFPGKYARYARFDPKYVDHEQFHRQERLARFAGARLRRRSRANGNSPRKSAAGCGCDGPVRGRQPRSRAFEAGAADGRGSCMLPPDSIRVVYGGTYAEQQKSFRDSSARRARRWPMVLVFIVLLFEFRTFAAPTAILASALLSTSGVFFALLVTGTTFNISSFMGLIMVIGIVAKNASIPHARCRSALSRRRILVAARSDDLKRLLERQAEADSYDRNGYRGRNDSAFPRHWRRFANAAAVGHRRNRRRFGVYGAIANRYANRPLLLESTRLEFGRADRPNTIWASGDVNQQADHGGGGALAADFARFGERRGIECAHDRFGARERRIQSREKLVASRARSFLGAKRCHLLFRKLLGFDVRHQAFGAAADVADVEAGRAEIVRRGPGVFGGEAFGIFRDPRTSGRSRKSVVSERTSARGPRSQGSCIRYKSPTSITALNQRRVFRTAG